MKIYDRLKKAREDNKGFTLVELIVVLVILAILAAILVPALLGYIDRAKESQYELEAKAVLTAMQGEASQLYANANLKSKLAVTDFYKDSKLTKYGTRVEQTSGVSNLTVTSLTTAFSGTDTDVDNTEKLHQAYTIIGVTITFTSAANGKNVTCVFDKDMGWTCTLTN